MFDKTQYKELIQKYMEKHNVSYIKAIYDMELETAEKMFGKMMIVQCMEKHKVSYTKAMHLLAIDQISDYNISMT